MSKQTKKFKNTFLKPAEVKADVAKPAPVPTPPKPELVKAAATPAPAVKVQAPALMLTAAATAAAGRVSLELVKPGAKSVCVAGSFNGWKPDKAPLVQMGNGRWVGDLSVNPGRYEYLFVVDGQWLPDPNAKEAVQNPFGGKNSVLTVSA